MRLFAMKERWAAFNNNNNNNNNNNKKNNSNNNSNNSKKRRNRRKIVRPPSLKQTAFSYSNKLRRHRIRRHRHLDIFVKNWKIDRHESNQCVSPRSTAFCCSFKDCQICFFRSHFVPRQSDCQIWRSDKNVLENVLKKSPDFDLAKKERSATEPEPEGSGISLKTRSISSSLRAGVRDEPLAGPPPFFLPRTRSESSVFFFFLFFFLEQREKEAKR